MNFHGHPVLRGTLVSRSSSYFDGVWGGEGKLRGVFNMHKNITQKCKTPDSRYTVPNNNNNNNNNNNIL